MGAWMGAWNGLRAWNCEATRTWWANHEACGAWMGTTGGPKTVRPGTMRLLEGQNYEAYGAGFHVF